MAFDPWYKTSFQFPVTGKLLELGVPHDVFSTVRIDEGTLLLLRHLPSGDPKRILDMGCGYGALGLPVASRFSRATVEMVDRDLLAVDWSAKNAVTNGLTNVVAYPSLGYRDLREKTPTFDWILCNVPARIGRPFIEHLLGTGKKLLTPGGELRVVVIRDLCPVIESLRADRGWEIREISAGPRHTVYALSADATGAGEELDLKDPDGLYARDTVKIGGDLELERPFDISGDSAKLVSALPALIDTLPRKDPGRAFFFRCGYGALPLLGRRRWPQSQVTALDRDLLATTFTRENARRLQLDGDRFEVRESVDLSRALGPEERFDLFVGELSSSAGEKVAEMDLVAMVGHLARGGEALVLTLEKLERDWIMPIAARRRISVTRLINREGNVVLRATRL